MLRHYRRRSQSRRSWSDLRDAELELVAAMLAGTGATTVLHVHGPGGVGKSTLLRRIAWDAESAGRAVTWTDGRDPDIPEVGPSGVLLLDEVDAVPPDGLAALLGRLPAAAVAVLAGREPPPAVWRTDPALSGPGGSLGDIGTHAFNLASFVTGLNCRELAAELSTFVPGRRVDDNVQIMLRFAEGARGMLWASQVAAGNQNNLRLRVFGEKAGIEWKDRRVFRRCDSGR